MREDYLKQASKVISDPNILINVVSKRVRQLQHEGMEPLIDTLEKLEPEDVALREIIEGKLSYELPDELLRD
ncbi:MAG: DNA-directed RNA polymerase subunit omega [Opitutae bacterium]|nr:DNA-directed RNA polymerase subunit omega [Opitutae bacterium]